VQPFWFVADTTFDAAALAAELGATWRGSILRRDGGAVDLRLRPERDHIILTLAAVWVWPWRWPASGRLERDLLRALARRTIRGADATSQAILDLESDDR
jgi:hypothetical protein